MKIHIAQFDHPASFAFCGRAASKCGDLRYSTASPRGVCRACRKALGLAGEHRLRANVVADAPKVSR
jgi:hypothetical protein